MKIINVEITGTSPLLMNNPQYMLEPKKAMTITTERLDNIKEAEKIAYRNLKGTLFIPSTAIKGTIINASSFRKIGKNSAKPIIAAGIRINPVEVELLDDKNKPIKDYVLDIRTVVLQKKNRIIKARPRVNKWKAQFDIVFNESMISEPEIIKAILEEAGQRVGLLDFRPQKLGDFGCFEITKWSVKK